MRNRVLVFGRFNSMLGGKRCQVYIPNQEVADEFKNAVEYSGWEAD